MNRALASHHLSKMYGAIHANMPEKKRIVVSNPENSPDIVRDIVSSLEKYGVINIDERLVDELVHRYQGQAILDQAFMERKRIGNSGYIDFDVIKNTLQKNHGGTSCE